MLFYTALFTSCFNIFLNQKAHIATLSVVQMKFYIEKEKGMIPTSKSENINMHD